MQDNRVIYKYIEKIFRERGNKTRTYDRLPKDSEGNNGDFAIHTANRGSNIYVKFANKWWFLSRLSKPTRESGKHIGVPPDGNPSGIINFVAIETGVEAYYFNDIIYYQ